MDNEVTQKITMSDDLSTFVCVCVAGMICNTMSQILVDTLAGNECKLLTHSTIVC